MAAEFQPRDPARFAAALQRFDAANSADPNKVGHGGVVRPLELAYAEWLTNWVLRLSPHASEELRLAARCQHLCRWMIPRSSCPPTRAGYLKWREDLKKFHARKSGQILRDVGYPEEVVKRVQDLNLKKGLAADPETRILEDALCLVFLEHQFAGLAARTTEDKMINAVQKTWRKMTAAGRQHALELQFPAREKALLQKALAGM